MDVTNATLNAIEERLLVLEKQICSPPAKGGEGETAEEAAAADPHPPLDAVERVKRELATRSMFSFRLKWVASGYYDLPLEERAKLLGAHPSQLCKTLIIENKKSSRADCSDPLDSRFYMVIVQYSAKLSGPRLGKVVARLSPEDDGNATPEQQQQQQQQQQQKGDKKKSPHMHSAKEEVGLALTGFPHNGVCPIGSLANVPILVAEAITQLKPPFVWMGGGHPLLKLGLSVNDLVTKSGRVVKVGDFTDAR